MIDDCIVMAGGSGTRLWPASTNSRPKQFLSLPPGGGFASQPEKSFFGAAIDRALFQIEDSSDGRVIIVAGRDHVKHIIEECAGLEAHKRKKMVLIPEPMPRQTAPAIACAVLYSNRTSPGKERNILVLTSDHIIHPPDIFKTDANTAGAMARANKLVVFGQQPTGPETGYGYIKTAGALTIPADEDSKTRKCHKPEVYSVASFHEKPNLEKAKQFVAAKNYYWNLGMFAFSTGFMLEEFQRYAPLVIDPFKKLMAPAKSSYNVRKGLRILETWEKLEEAYRETKAVSFDYAVAEKCNSVVMVKGAFSWADVGSWDEYARLTKHAGSEVYSTGKTSGTCFVDSDMPVALCGVEDLIVIARSGKDGRPPTLLISKKGETQQVREIVEKIKAAGRNDLL